MICSSPIIQRRVFLSFVCWMKKSCSGYTVAAGWVVVDPHLVIDFAIELGVELGLEDVLEDAELRLLLGLEALWVVEHLAAAVAEDVRRVPAVEAEHARLQHRREHRLDQG